MLEIAYPTTTKLDKSYNVQYKFTTISAGHWCLHATGPQDQKRQRGGSRMALSFQQIVPMMDPIPVVVSQNVTNKSCWYML